MRPAATLITVLRAALLLAAPCLLVGCATVPLDKARSDFYAGRFSSAEESLIPPQDEDKDQTLFLMERGMVRQAMGDYEQSAIDWRSAAERDEQFETYSLSQGAASLVSSDRVISFRGKPFERVLLFAFLAKSYLAVQNWDYAAICARNIIQQLEKRESFPDSAYSRYMAGFCLGLIGDTGNAASQYRTASELIPNLNIDENSGMISEQDEPTDKQTKESGSFEFICFVGMGSAAPPASRAARFANRSFYADFYQDGVYLGRSRELDNVGILAHETERQEALLKAAKSVARIAVKETIAQTLEQQNELLGALTRFTLFAMEAPDTRRWETLPLRLAVFRGKCRQPVTSYTVVFRDAVGNAVRSKTVAAPIARRGNAFISFCRDLPNPVSQP